MVGDLIDVRFSSLLRTRRSDLPRGPGSATEQIYRTPFPIACRDAIRISLPQAKVLDRRRQGLGLVALAVARDLCGIPLKAVVVQDFAIGS